MNNLTKDELACALPTISQVVRLCDVEVQEYIYSSL